MPRQSLPESPCESLNHAKLNHAKLNGAKLNGAKNEHVDALNLPSKGAFETTNHGNNNSMSTSTAESTTEKTPESTTCSPVHSPGLYRWPRSASLVAVVLALIPLVLMAISLWLLSPSEQGLGTHQQLGLPPCSVRVVFGMRCPACGMTTSWAHFVRGQWWQSANANPGGFLLAIYSLSFAAIALWAAIQRRLPAPEVTKTMAITLVAIAVVTVINWLAGFA